MNSTSDISHSEDDYLIERFSLQDTDYSNLAKLISEAFTSDEIAQIEGTSILFDQETFQRIFGSPYLPQNLFVHAIHKPTGKLVGFIGAIPRNLSYKGKVYKFAVGSWLAVHPQHQKHGLAFRMTSYLQDFLIKEGFDGGFALHEPEQKGILVSKSLSRKTGRNRIIRIMTIHKFLIRIFDINKMDLVMKLSKIEKLGIKLLSPSKTVQPGNPHVRPYKKEDGEKLFQLLQDHIERNEMSIVRDHYDFFWYLAQPGVNCVIHEDNAGIVDGFVLAWKFKFAGFGNEIPFGWLDLVHIHRLKMKEATDLCLYFADSCKKLGWVGIQSPYIPYFPAKPFKKAKFIFFPKTLTVDVFVHENTQCHVPDKIKSFYFDWR